MIKGGFNIKIAQVCHRYHPFVGGVETHVKEISKRLVKKGFEVEVLTVDTSGRLLREEVFNGVKVRRFKSWSPRSIAEVYFSSWGLWRYLIKNSLKYDVVHAHNYHAFPSLYAAYAKRTNKFVFTPHYHGAGSYFFRNMLHIPYKVLGRKIFEKADKVICVSHYEKNLVLEKIEIDENKVTVIPNGLDLNQHKEIQRRNRNFKSILYVGRIEKYKGIQYVLKSLSKLEDNYVAEIVGVGPYKAELTKLAINLGVEKRVKFYLNLSRRQLLQKYADADVFTMLSARESYGITVAEALSLGTPCIVTNNSALKDWVDGKNCFGIYYPPNIEELANLISKVSGMRADWRSMQKRALSWDCVAEKTLEVYESL